MWPHKVKYGDMSVNLRAAFAEFLAMTLFVFTGCSVASIFSLAADTAAVRVNPTNGEVQVLDYGTFHEELMNMTSMLKTTGSWGITVALTFGFAIAVLAYSFAHISGAQINCAITWALFLSGQLGPVQAVLNVIGQLVGSLLGAGFVYAVVPDSSTWPLGANMVSPLFSNAQAFFGEAIMTFVLCLTVLLTATDKRSVAKNLAPLAIGLAVFLGHAVLIPVDGCSINPTRSFGPAVVSGHWKAFWVFVIGPLLGSTFSVLFYFPLCCDFGSESEKATAEKVTEKEASVGV